MTRTFPLIGRILEDAVAARVFPGAVVEIGRTSGPLATLTRGAQTYDGTQPVETSTIYDLASLTKVLATTAIVARLVDADRLGLSDSVHTRSEAWSGTDRASVTIQDLLEHCSGLPGHRPYYHSLRGRDAFEAAIGVEPLACQPRTQSIYSDPGFMLLGFILERVSGAPLDRLFDQWRDVEVGADVEIRYRPPPRWLARIAPTESAPAGEERRGIVHDENAEALGGVAGHAGLFGTAEATGACARWWMQHAEALAPFLRKSTTPGSSRALGWDTMLPTSSCGTRFSSRAFGHTGFTGTSVWIDPARDLYVVMLSNRVHPTREGDGIQAVRRALHDTVVADLG